MPGTLKPKWVALLEPKYPVVENFDEQEHYYTSFEQEQEGFFAVTKNTKPDFEHLTNENGEEYRKMVKNSAFTRSVLRKYYNTKIYQYFTNSGYLVKPNFINDIEIWFLKKKSDIQYHYYEKFSLRVQLARITDKPELMISSARISKVFKRSVLDLLEIVPLTCFNWVVYEKSLYKYEELPGIFFFLLS